MRLGPTITSGLTIAAMCLLTAAKAVQSQDFPSRPITLIVPLGAGASLDIIARVLGQDLSDRLGKAVIVENRTGGGTLIAANSVARAVPDGYTLMIAPSATLTSNATIYRQLPYNPRTDFIPLALVSQLPFVLVVNPSLPIHSFADLVNFAKQRPGTLSYASNGNGQAPHLAAELLKQLSGIEMTHVPYRGMPQAIHDVIAGDVHLVFADPVTASPLIHEGKLRALGVSSETRIPLLPDVPPLSEAGARGFEIVSWQMVVAPTRTPREIVKRLHAEISDILTVQEFRLRLTKMGLIPSGPTSIEDLQQFLEREIDRWGKLVEQAGLARSQ